MARGFLGGIASSQRRFVGGHPVRTVAAASVILAFGSVTFLAASPARSLTEYEPIGITVYPTTLVPGAPLPVQVDLDGAGSAAVTVYSDPPGAVSYQGTLQSGDTISASTNPALPASTVVTVYAETDGQTVVQTQVPVQ